jgi:hypothetical protein
VDLDELTSSDPLGELRHKVDELKPCEVLGFVGDDIESGGKVDGNEESGQTRTWINWKANARVKSIEIL